ncbi:unnamed protein product [Lymnaea stagnalis]|uniref:CUB domain-containing protein n=1 Tax=Lymnaea stagnalis TaxID=6523 RepID=A0AAV2HJK4_LYMST
MKPWRAVLPGRSPGAISANDLVAAAVICCIVCHVDSQTQHLPMRRPNCNSVFRKIPAAALEGAGGYRMAEEMCEVTLSAPGRAVWMLKLDRAVILDCDVVLQVFDTQISPPSVKPLLSHGCASSDPGIININSSTITVRLRHSNSSSYSFTLIATAKKPASKVDLSCGAFRCEHGACISKTLMCDAVDNCFDLSDESSNGTAFCEAGYWPFPGENWGVLASVLGAAIVLGVTAACCRHLRAKRELSVDEIYEMNEGPYVHKYAYRYAIIRPPKKPNITNVVLGRDGHMHYNATEV